MSGAFFFATPAAESSQRNSFPFTAALLALAFGGTLLTVFRIEFRQNAILFSLSEIPLVFSLVYLAPTVGIPVRILASAFVYVAVKRPPLHKQLFNLSMFASETAAAYYIARTFIAAGDQPDLRIIVVSTLSVTAAGVLGSIEVALAISRVSGDTLRRIVDELKAAWVLLVNGAMAGALLSLYVLSPAFAVLAIVPVFSLWFMMRRHGELAQRLRDLRDVHGFAGRVGRSLDLTEIGESAVSESARLLRADTTMLALVESNGPARIFTTGASSRLRAMDIDDWAPLLTGSSTASLCTGNDAGKLGLIGFDPRDQMIIAQVDDEIGTIGILIITRRANHDLRFSQEDVSQVQNLAEQLASSLRKGMLHRRIEFEARHDALTGLPNRAAFERRLEDVTARQSAPGQKEFLLMMDLDRFKEVNDTLGHHAGDDLLIEFARRIAKQLGRDDFLCRLAGDEFAAIVHAADEEAVFDLARTCIEDAARPVILDGLSIVITASVGIATISPDDDDPQTPLRHADIAMYNAKSRHVGVELFRPEIDRRTPARLSMLGDLRDAIELEDLGIEYQPKLDLATGLITGVEALVRWTHVVRGVVAPAEFVRVAEDTGLIKQLTDLMLARGIVELARWHQQGHQLTLSVNLSTHDLLDVNLPSRVDGYLRDNDVDPGSLTLEITESSLLIDAPRTQATIHELNALGVRLSIDDFGTGYSSLSYLRQLPVRELKVDQSFIANMLLDQQDEVIVRSTIDLGHNLGLEVVAEGVESDAVVDRLRDFGCDVAQGFCVSRPLTAERLQTWLHTTHHAVREIDPLEPDSWTVDLARPGLDDLRPDT